jgi:hypothetical protein
MKREIRLAALLPPLLAVMLTAAGCGGMFKDVVPKKNAREVGFLPVFSWKAKDAVADLKFELYRAADFNVEAKQAVGEPILRAANFTPFPEQKIALADTETLISRYRAEGEFLASASEGLEPETDYVWVLSGTGPKGPIMEIYKFRTRKDYYRPD